MSQFRFREGNLGFYAYDRLANYTEASRNDTTMVLDWNPARGVLDPAVSAGHVTLSYSGYQSYVVEDGPDAGAVRVTGGTLTGITYSSDAGSVLLEISRLAVRLPTFLAMLERGDGYAAWQMVTQGAAAITGSTSAAGPGHAGSGDFIDTTLGNDMVYAMAGDDFVQDRGGSDSLYGGSGFDTLSYAGWNFTPWALKQGIAVDLLTGTVKGPDGLTDSVSGFEDISGTLLNDSLRGNAGANMFEGGAGADVIDGRGGRDTVSYAKDADWGGTDGIRVNLGTGTVRDGFGFVDRVMNAETIIGTATRDVFFDNGADNAFFGGAGNDVFHFSLGNDYGQGGAGADTFWFDGAFSDDTLSDFNPAEGDRLRIAAATAFGQIHLGAITTDQGPAVLVQFGTNSITLEGMTLSALHAADFGF